MICDPFTRFWGIVTSTDQHLLQGRAGTMQSYPWGASFGWKESLNQGYAPSPREGKARESSIRSFIESCLLLWSDLGKDREFNIFDNIATWFFKIK